MELKDSGKYRYSAMQYGYNQDTTNRNRMSDNDRWFYSYPEKLSKIKTLKEECIRAAKLIRDRTDLPIHILMSGGCDSTIIAESFRLAKIPFTGVICRLTDGINEYDICKAINYCEQYSIKHYIIELDIFKFWKEDILEYTIPVQARSPQVSVQNWLIDQTDGFPIRGEGTVALMSKPPDIFAYEKEQLQVVEKWLIHRDRPGVSSFFKYTKELWVAANIDEAMIKWMEFAKTTPSGTIDSKHDMFSKWCPSVTKRPFIYYQRFVGSPKMISRVDYTGFELITPIDRKYRDEICTLFPEAYDETILIPYKEYLNEMTGGEPIESFMEGR